MTRADWGAGWAGGARAVKRGRALVAAGPCGAFASWAERIAGQAGVVAWWVERTGPIVTGLGFWV